MQIIRSPNVEFEYNDVSNPRFASTIATRLAMSKQYVVIPSYSEEFPGAHRQLIGLLLLAIDRDDRLDRDDFDAKVSFVLRRCCEHRA